MALTHAADENPPGVQLRNVSAIDSYGLNAGYYGALASGALRYGLTLTQAHTRIKEPGGVSAETRGVRAAPSVPSTRP